MKAKRKKLTPIDLFQHVWQNLAEAGKCDSWGGHECERVLQEWIVAGKPPAITGFIIDTANPPAPSADKGGVA